MNKSGVTLMVIPNDKTAIKEYTISRFFTVTAVSLAVTMAASLAFFSYGYFTKTVDGFKLKSLQEENLVLLDKIDEINTDMLALKSRLDNLSSEDDMLRVLADLPQIHEDIRRVGVGGPEYVDEQTVNKLSSRTLAMTKKTMLDLDQLLREVKLQEASFNSIKNTILQNQDEIARIPTIQPTYGYITCGYGYRRHPFTGRREFHRGVDIANRMGTPIYATADGVVIHIGYQRAYGKLVIVDHGNGYTTRYAHLSEIARGIRKGSRVKRHDMIAKMGSSGRSTGPHLHYEVLKSGKWINPYLHFYGEDVLANR